MNRLAQYWEEHFEEIEVDQFDGTNWYQSTLPRPLADFEFIFKIGRPNLTFEFRGLRTGDHYLALVTLNHENHLVSLPSFEAFFSFVPMASERLAVISRWECV